MPLPVRRSGKPKLNAPLWAGSSVAAFLVIYNGLADLGLPAIVVGIIAAAIVIAALVSQAFTKPSSSKPSNTQEKFDNGY